MVCLQENVELFRADVTSQSWKDYIIYIDGMVLDEFDNFIHKSLSYLINNMVLDVSDEHKTRDVCTRRCVCTRHNRDIVNTRFTLESTGCGFRPKGQPVMLSWEQDC